MNTPKSIYIYPELNGHKVLYRGKRFWVFEINSEFPFEGHESYCDVIVFDKGHGDAMAGAKKTSKGYKGSIFDTLYTIEITGETPTELVDSTIEAWRSAEKNFAGVISQSTPRVRKRESKK
jgi:hypothetical protein